MNTLIIEQTEMGEMPIDIYTKLSRDRILFINDPIDDTVATDIVATLMLKDAENSEEKITLLLNSEVADIRCAFMIYDVMSMIECPVETVCVGSVMNEVVMILAAGTPGMRFATKNSVICPSQLTYDRSYMSNLDDAKLILDQFKADNKKMMEIIAKSANKSFAQTMSDFERKMFMTAEQAKKYGIIDRVIGGK